jgi:hypothetical protein
MKMKVIPGGSQMSLIRDTEEVMKFLEFVGRKAILSEQAVNCKLTACHNLFSVINEEEDNVDYMLQNLDVLVNRFRNKNANVRGSTLKVYKSRVKSSLEDYKGWSTDPFQWERSLTDKVKASGLERRKEKKDREAEPEAKAPRLAKAKRDVKKASSSKPVASAAMPESATSLEAPEGFRRVAFPVRNGCTVEVCFPEGGLTTNELNRLGMFLYPYCSDIDPKTTRWPVS